MSVTSSTVRFGGLVETTRAPESRVVDILAHHPGDARRRRRDPWQTVEVAETNPVDITSVTLSTASIAINAFAVAASRPARRAA